MKIKTSELEGVALDWAVAQIMVPEGFEVRGSWKEVKYKTPRLLFFSGDEEVGKSEYSPSKYWEECGEVLEELGISIQYFADHWQAHIGKPIPYAVGETAQLAICRCAAAFYFGIDVDIPDELVSQ